MHFSLLQVAGVEPARDCSRGILSPLRLPIPPHLRTLCQIACYSRKRGHMCMHCSSWPHQHANGQRWIRTTEAICSRFTVCPLWPLGNLPIHQFFNRLYIYTILHTKVQAFFLLYYILSTCFFWLSGWLSRDIVCTRPYVNAGTWRGLFESSTAAL